MEPVTFLVVGLSVGAASALTWNLYHARNALQGVSDRTIVLSESQGAHAKQTTDALVLLQKKIDHYDGLLEALRATHPTVDFGMRAHQARLLHWKVESFLRAWYKMQLTLFILQFHCKVSISTCPQCRPK